MNSKFNLQFFGGQAQIWRQRKPTNNMSYSAPGIRLWRIPKSNQTTRGQGLSGLAGNNGVVNDLANIVRARTLPKRYAQVRAAI